MGLRLAKVLSFLRTLRNEAWVSDVKVDRAGGDNRTPEHYADPGDDSFPLSGDYAATGNFEGNTRSAVIGYLDPVNEPKAAAGDKRIYARDASTGVLIVDFWLKNDGTAITENKNGRITLAPDGSTTIESPIGTLSIAADGEITGSNAGGSFQLQPGGDFVVNGAKITSSGDFVDSSGKNLRTHVHPQGNDSGGDSQQNTGAPI